MSTAPIQEAGSDGDAEFWRARAEQLQAALDSRVVIEQAKGVLAERFGWTVDDAFAALRRAARTNRVKLHELAADVVASAAGQPPRALLDVGVVRRDTPPGTRPDLRSV